jgi:hypothetical protein
MLDVMVDRQRPPWTLERPSERYPVDLRVLRRITVDSGSAPMASVVDLNQQCL